MMHGRHRAGLAIVALGLVLVPSARAQMMLPGAMNGRAQGTPAAPSGGTSAPSSEVVHTPPKPIVVKPPAEDAIVGHVLSHDGSSGAMTFDMSGTDLVLSKLALAGDKISVPTQACSLDVALPSPLVVASAGRPTGAIRYHVPIAACPFDIDVLDGAVLVSTASPTCDFKAADCRVSVGGLWGPTPTEISPKRAKDLERQRVRIETTMRANFRALLKRAGKDRAAIRAIARDQAGFSSEREVTCRDYAQETVHGFCSTQITEARVLALLAQFDASPDQSVPHRRPRPKPKAKAAAVGSAAAPASQPLR